jgi:hypothetical protein
MMNDLAGEGDQGLVIIALEALIIPTASTSQYVPSFCLLAITCFVMLAIATSRFYKL